MITSCGVVTQSQIDNACEGKSGQTVTVGGNSVVCPTVEQNAVDAAVQSTIEAMDLSKPEPAATAEFSSGSSNTTQVANTEFSSENGTYGKFTPVWTGLPKDCPTAKEILAAHGLTKDMLVNNDVEPVADVVWESCLIAIEFKPQYYGTEIPLVLGYQYTADLTNGEVTEFMGGDPNVKSVTLEHGTTFRYGPTYVANHAGQWLNPNDVREVACRDARFGYYHRVMESGLPHLPYHDRLGPYGLKMGNFNIDWVAPSPDQVVPKNYMDACAMLGGLARENEWTTDGTNWAWKYSAKVAGSADYCPAGDPCWQTTYVPQNASGYIELWNGTGPQKFFASDLSKLMSGRYNVDEFSYHPYNE